MYALIEKSHAELVAELLAPFYIQHQEPSTDSLQQQPESVSTSLLDHKLSVARELLIRQLTDHLQHHPVMNSPKVVKDWLLLNLGHLEHEVFMVLFLDVQHRLICPELMARGTLSHANIHVREVVKSALKHNAGAVILAHNHPSHSDQPSSADFALTRQLTTALELIEVTVLDHVIVAGANLVSFAEKGWLSCGDAHSGRFS